MVRSRGSENWIHCKFKENKANGKSQSVGMLPNSMTRTNRGEGTSA
jgi:hypothetical protein